MAISETNGQCITSSQSNLTQGRIAAAHERFSHIRQVVPMCTPSSPPQSASAPYWCCSLVSRFEYIDRRTSLGTATYPSKLPFMCGDLNPVWYVSLGTPESTSKMTSQLVEPFLQGSLLWQTNTQTGQQTERPRYSICNNRPHLRVVQCSLKLCHLMKKISKDINQTAVQYKQLWLIQRTQQVAQLLQRDRATP